MRLSELPDWKESAGGRFVEAVKVFHELQSGIGRASQRTEVFLPLSIQASKG